MFKSGVLLFLYSLQIMASEETLEKIQVTQHQHGPESMAEFLPGNSILKDQELDKRRGSNLADTIGQLSGVRSSSYGPGVGRPVIRGLEGERLMMLQNGLGIMDASALSADHGVPLDTLSVESVELVRGPTALLFGPYAAGGVVNATTSRIHADYSDGFVSELQAKGDSSQNALDTGARFDYGSNQWMMHVDGGYRNANELFIPGNQKSDHLDAPGTFESKNRLPNSQNVQHSQAIGLTRFFNHGHLGFSLNSYENYYGSPAEEAIRINMQQDRLELGGELQPTHPWIKAIRLKSAQTDYTHQEIEEGSVGTTFSNEGNESRLEILSQAEKTKGISGIQTKYFNFKSVGEEAYLPQAHTRQLALFTLQDFDQGDDAFSLALRYEGNLVSQESGDKNRRDFAGANASVGFRHKFTETHMGLINLNYTERAPGFQELYADGFHVAAGTFEIGESTLKEEKNLSLEASLKYQSDVVKTNLAVFVQNYRDYIFLELTDNPSSEPGINESVFNQADAVFYGMEFDGKKRLGDSPWSLLLKGEWLRGRNRDTGHDLPRIAPPRLTSGFEWEKNNLLGDVEMQYNFEQTHTAPAEIRTDAFWWMEAGLRYNLSSQNSRWSIFARGKNLLNQEARVHTSTLKDIAPQAARHVVLGMKYLF